MWAKLQRTTKTKQYQTLIVCGCVCTHSMRLCFEGMRNPWLIQRDHRPVNTESCVVKKNCFGHSSNEKSSYKFNWKKNTQNKWNLFFVEWWYVREETLKYKWNGVYLSNHPIRIQQWERAIQFQRVLPTVDKILLANAREDLSSNHWYQFRLLPGIENEQEEWEIVWFKRRL